MITSTITNGASAEPTPIHDTGKLGYSLEDDVRKTFFRRLDLLGGQMKKHPLLTIGLGLGAGYLIARLVHRPQPVTQTARPETTVVSVVRAVLAAAAAGAVRQLFVRPVAP